MAGRPLRRGTIQQQRDANLAAIQPNIRAAMDPTPQGPNLISVTPSDDQSILVQWEGDSSFDGYNVKRGTAHGGPYSAVARTARGVTSYTDTGLSNTMEFFYVVSAHIDSSFPGDPDESNNSNELSATPTVTVTFNNPGATDTPLNGVYDNELDFGPPGGQPWYWRGSGPGSAIYLGPPGASGTVTGNFSFASMTPLGRILRRVRVIADPAVSGNIAISDQANPTITQPVIAGSPPTFIDTMWGNPSQTITITSDVGWDIAIDVLAYEGPP